MKYKQIVPEVAQILNQYSMPLTLRQVFYRLVSKLLIPNTVTSYKGLSRILVKARERGDIDDTRMEDRSRRVLGSGDGGYEDPEEFIDAKLRSFKDCWEYYTKPMWENQPKAVLIGLEKDALSRIFGDIASRWRIRLYTTKGYGSYTFVKDMAREVEEHNGMEKEIKVLFFGDYDPSGRDIERDLTDRLVRYSGVPDFDVQRIALTKEQISEFNLPPRPEDAETLAKLARDPRAAKYGTDLAVELDALEPPVLQRMIREAIRENIDREAWKQKRAEIEEEKEQIREKLEGLTLDWETD